MSGVLKSRSHQQQEAADPEEEPSEPKGVCVCLDEHFNAKS